MSQIPCEKSQTTCGKLMNADILNDPNEMVYQMVLPLVPRYKTERAIEIVARASGLSYSKTFNLYYRRTFDVWSKKKKKLIRAFRDFALEQEALYRDGATRFAEINAEIERLERQYGIPLEINPRVAGELEIEPTDRAP